jgi:AhpD family alkylhydroperoxidase
MRTLPELDPLRLHAPDSYAAFVAAGAITDAILPAGLAAEVGHRVAAGLGLTVDSPESGSGIAAIVDQFVLYSPGITAEHRAAAAAMLPEGLELGTFMHAVYVVDQLTRQRVALSRLFEASAEPAGEPPPGPEAASLEAAVSEMHAAAMRLDRVDPVTTELVRLRAADYHHCRICATVRLVAAAEAGADEIFLTQRRDFESSGLPDAQKSALRLADAYMAHPAGIDDAFARDLDRHLDPAQIVEILLDVSAFNLQKVYVTLELDAPPEGGETALSFDERGHSVIR